LNRRARCCRCPEVLRHIDSPACRRCPRLPHARLRMMMHSCCRLRLPGCAPRADGARALQTKVARNPSYVPDFSTAFSHLLIHPGALIVIDQVCLAPAASLPPAVEAQTSFMCYILCTCCARLERARWWATVHGE